MEVIHYCIKYSLSLIIFIFILIIPAKAQTVQWASDVIDFSSELTPLQYAAGQILGKPDVLPSGGESPNAWTPAHANRLEFIKVGYDNPMEIRQIAIAESFNPGAVLSVYIYDEKNQEYLINTFDPRSVPLKGRMLNLFIEKTQFKVKAVKIKLHGAAHPDYSSLDAIAISDSDIPIEAEINVPEFINPEMRKERLGKHINSRYKEYKPLLSPDGQTLYFSRQNHPENIGGKNDYEDIWYTKLDENGEWQPAKNIGKVLNNKGPNFVSSVIPDDDAELMLLGNKYMKRNKMAAGVSLTSNATGSWSEPEALEIRNDYNYADRANYFLTNNRKILLMALMREDAQGERDLYVSFLQGDGSWSSPLNLSDHINTAGEESSPFLSSDYKTLYFSSNGYAGYGGSDIFLTVRLDSTWRSWSEPKNLGPNINSPAEDLFFNIPTNGKYAYFCQGVGMKDVDIFRIRLPLFKFPQPVTAIKTMFPEAPQAAADLIGKRISARTKTTAKKATLVLNCVFFNFDKVVPSAASFATLDYVASLLHGNNDLKIAIEGHTDSSGSAAYNLELSQRRARSVYNYLIGKGIERQQLELRYYGEAKPGTDNTTAEGRRKNRRVEFEMIN